MVCQQVAYDRMLPFSWRKARQARAGTGRGDGKGLAARFKFITANGKRLSGFSAC